MIQAVIGGYLNLIFYVDFHTSKSDILNKHDFSNCMSYIYEETVVY